SPRWQPLRPKRPTSYTHDPCTAPPSHGAAQGSRSCRSVGPGRVRRSPWPRCRSDFEQPGFLALEQLVDLRDVPVGEVVELFHRTMDLVLTGLAVLHHLVQDVLGVTADVP